MSGREIRMQRMVEEAQAFGGRKAEEARMAANRVALFAACGIDLEAALAAPPAHKRLLRLRLKRLIERERLRGEKRHWSYDLNRHIALKQAHDLLGPATAPGARANENGARRRRSMVRGTDAELSSCSCGRAPSSWQARSAPRHSSAQPSDRSHPDPTFRGTGRASGRNASSDGA